MAVRLLISFEDVRSISKSIDSAAGEIDSTVSDLRTKADPAGIWEGAAAEAYWTLLDQWETNFNDFTEAMRGLAQMITSFADAMEAGDEEAATKILSAVQ